MARSNPQNGPQVDLSALIPSRVWSAVLTVFSGGSVKRLTESRQPWLMNIRVRTRHDGVVVTATDGWTLVEITWTIEAELDSFFDVLVTLSDAIKCARGEAVDFVGRKGTDYPETDVIIRPFGVSSAWELDRVTYGMNGYLASLPWRVAERLEFAPDDAWTVTHGSNGLQPVIWWNRVVPKCLPDAIRVETCVVIMPRRID
jgi:hypothetical protein